MTDVVLAIDLGGTKIAVGVVDGTGRILVRDQVATDADPVEALPGVLALCRALLARAGSARMVAAALAVPGPIDFRAGAIVGAPNVRGWWTFPLCARLSEALGVPVQLANDANAATLGEHRYGAGRNARNLVYFTVSTGVGSGAIVDGRLLYGEDGNAPELGHCSIHFQGRVCRCGLIGCLEEYASGTSIAEQATLRVRSGEPSSLAELARTRALTAIDVSQAVERGDPLAKSIWDEAMTALAAGVGNAIDTFNPKLVIIGGGLTNAGPLLFDPVREQVKGRALGALQGTVRIVPAALGKDVGVLGAAALAWDVAYARTT